MEKFCKVYQKRSSLIMYIVGSLFIMTIAAIYMNFADVFSMECSMQEFRGCCFENPIFYAVLGKGLLTYFGFCIAVFTFMLVRPYCLFYLNDEGFWAQDYGFVRWENVADIGLKNIACQTVISFSVKNKDELKVPFMTKIFKFFNRGDYYIELSSSYNEVNEVLKMMKSYVS